MSGSFASVERDRRSPLFVAAIRHMPFTSAGLFIKGTRIESGNDG